MNLVSHKNLKKPALYDWLIIWSALFLLVLFVVKSKAQALSGDDVDAFRQHLSSHSDPKQFVENLDIILPRPVVVMSRLDAVAHELLTRSKSLSEAEALSVATAIVGETQNEGYNPLLFVALIRAESNFNHLALSPVGAEGLMQLMPYTAVWLAKSENIDWPERHSFDPTLNVRLGTRYLISLHKKFRGNLSEALTAYNRGPGATKSIVKRHGRLPRDIRDFYATKVLEHYKVLRQRYGHLPRS
jgi:soluble lytic murein transglycosylase-like protein